MTFNEQLELDLIRHLARASAVAKKLERLENVPDEPPCDDKDGANVIWFKKRFPNSPAWYTYAAVQCKVNGRTLWYTTGPRTPKGFTWDELVNWMYSSEVDVVWQATGWTKIADKTS